MEPKKITKDKLLSIFTIPQITEIKIAPEEFEIKDSGSRTLTGTLLVKEQRTESESRESKSSQELSKLESDGLLEEELIEKNEENEKSEENATVLQTDESAVFVEENPAEIQENEQGEKSPRLQELRERGHEKIDQVKDQVKEKISKFPKFLRKNVSKDKEEVIGEYKKSDSLDSVDSVILRTRSKNKHDFKLIIKLDKLLIIDEKITS